MSRPIALHPLPFFLAMLSLGLLAGCGGTNTVENDTIPTETLQFQSVSSDFNGGSTDIPSTTGSVGTNIGTTTIFATLGMRTVSVKLPTASFTPGRTLNFSSAAAVTSEFTSTSPTDAVLRWKANTGSVRIVSSTGQRAVVQIRGARYIADGASAGSAGTFTLSGTITAVPLIE